MITTIIKKFLIVCYYRLVNILRLLKNKLKKDKSMPYGKKKGRPLKSTPVKKVKKKSKKKS